MAEGFITRKGGGVNVNDATATENDVLQGKTFYSGDKDIKTGNIPSKGSETFTPSTSNQTIASGQYLSGTQTILGDPDLIPENIKDGVNIFGVNGTLQVVSTDGHLDFDGSGDRVQMGNYSIYNFGTIPFKMTMRFEADDLTPNPGHRILFAKRTAGFAPGYPAHDLGINEDGSLFWFIKDANDRLRVDSAAGVISIGTRYDVEVERYSNGNMVIRLDGNVVGTNSGTLVQANTNDVMVLGWNKRDNRHYFDGRIYDFKVYRDGNLVASYDFETQSGSTLFDQVGNNDGTIYNATWGID